MRLHATNPVPAARTGNLVTTESHDETLVYDTARHHIHHLNPVSSVIWRLCDGWRSMSDIVRNASLELDAAADDTSVRITLAPHIGERTNRSQSPLRACLWT
ncbi:MAG: PqqD family protein [Chloroflexota bacterium]|nr:PqqD family protein [Chloroflexota bacterium]